MNQHELQKRLIRYQGEIEQISFWLSRAKQSLPEDFDGYRSSLQDAAGLAERLTCGIRDIRVETCFLPRAEVLRESAQIQGIMVEAEEHWHRILLPGLLPKRKTGSCAFLTGPLAAALTEYGKTHPIQRLQRAVVCFLHLYSMELPERLVRDHDNIEVKQVLDVIADHFLADDNGLLCTNLYTSAMGGGEGTEVYVMAKELAFDFEGESPYPDAVSVNISYIPEEYRMTSSWEVYPEVFDYSWNDHEEWEWEWQICLSGVKISQGASVGIDNEHSDITAIDFSAQDVIYLKSNTHGYPCYLSWTLDGYSMMLIVPENFPEAESIKIAEGIELVY